MFKHLTLELTHQCNNNCYYCYNKYRDISKLNYMNIEIAKKHIRDILQSRVEKNCTERDIAFSGGEPTLDNDYLIELISYSSTIARLLNKKVTFNINTNCTNISDKLIKTLKVNKNFGLFISAITSKKDLYNRITCTDNYDLFIENLKKVIDNNILHSCNIVTNLLTYDALEESVDFFMELGVESIVTSIAHGKIDGYFTKKEYDVYIKQCLKLKEKYKSKFGFSPTLYPCLFDCHIMKNENGRQLRNCSYLSSMLSITPENCYVGCCRQPLNLFINANSYDEACVKSQKVKELLPEFNAECQNCILNCLCYGFCGYENQIENDSVSNFRKANIMKAAKIVQNEKTLKAFCSYFKKYNKFPEEVEYVHDNLYYIWEVLNIFKEVFTNAI